MTERKARIKLGQEFRPKTVARKAMCWSLFYKVPAVWGRGGS